MLNVPNKCLPLLREQRTHYYDPSKQYGEEIARTYETFCKYLPKHVDDILDVGSGMAGIDVYLGKCYPNARLHLLDKQGISEDINSGFKPHAEDFSHYNDFNLALNLLRENGVENEIIFQDLLTSPEIPNITFGVVVSLLSWGFHYPISTYTPRCDGIMVVDVRRGTNGELELEKFGHVTVIHERQKYRRVVVEC